AAACQSAGDIIMAVEFRSRERDEKIARGDGAAVDRDAIRLPRAAGVAAAGRGSGVLRGPERRHSPASARMARMMAASSKGRVLSPMIWPRSWPLPATS